MTKSEIIKRLKDKYPQLQADEAANIVDLLFNEMADALVKKSRIEIRGFGTFSLRKREARTARNPKTGEKVNVKERYVTYFRAGKGLKDKLNAE
jgi:integration host factor subunit beta